MKPEVICCGLGTVDVQLHSCEVPLHLEHITPFSHTTSTAGGSSPQTAQSLAALSLSTTALTPVGSDSYAQQLKSLLSSNHVDTSALVEHTDSPTALAILPLFNDGRRGCFVTLGANLAFRPEQAVRTAINAEMLNGHLKAFHFGYPHLMRHFQGQNLLNDLFLPVRKHAPNALLTLDLNGASKSDDEGSQDQSVVTPSLPVVSHVHANLEEACVVSGLFRPSTSDTLSASQVQRVCDWFLSKGVATVSITCGQNGAFFATSTSKKILRGARLAADSLPTGAFIHRSAFKVGTDQEVNASGAGDAFVAGIIAQLVHSKGGTCGIERILDSGLASALRRIDSTLISVPTEIEQVVNRALNRSRIPPRSPLLDGYGSLKTS